MSWFKRIKNGILTRTEDKKGSPDGMWNACPSCKESIPTRKLEENAYTCFKCNHHFRIGSGEYFYLLYDDAQFSLHFEAIVSSDPLKFTDSKPYPERVKASMQKTNLNDAVRVAYGKVEGSPIVVAAMDFKFIGGSMGSVVGEKLSKSIDLAIKKKCPLMIISKSGGARMMEGAFSLMQMAKVSAKLTLLSDKKLPYYSLLTDPTTGGVTASFAMLGDLNFAEPKALIGFAGPRVIKETIGKDLPEGFQRSEFLLEHGFLDFIVDRKDLKSKLGSLLKLLKA